MRGVVPGGVDSVYHQLKKPIFFCGYGSIGRGALPLLERHFAFDKDQVTILDPETRRFGDLTKRGYKNLIGEGLTQTNYVDILTKKFGKPSGKLDGDGVDGSVRGLFVNLSVNTETAAIMKLCRELGVVYLDTVVEPWGGFYFDSSLTPAERSNYALREDVQTQKNAQGGRAGTTAITCCGANPGMVSWFTKEALMILNKDLGRNYGEPTTREEWAQLMCNLGVKGIHVAERDTQVSKVRRPAGTFCNTWSCEGFISEGLQPAELGWGTHEKWFPPNAKRHEKGCKAAIYLERPGADTRVRTWVPTFGPQHGLLVTHNEAISISDYYTVGSGDNPVYRPTCHYCYHPCDDAIASLRECFGNNYTPQEKTHVYTEHDILTGVDELGVLLYGHEKNALWRGSTLSHEEAFAMNLSQNATGMQVSSAAIAALVWALENPKAGIIEADDLCYKRCLEVQRPYLGKVHHTYTDWTPLRGIVKDETNACLFSPPKRAILDDPWQFANVLVDGDH